MAATYIPGISAAGTLAPGLTPAAVRAVLELLSSAEIAAAYLPLAGGTMTGDLDMGGQGIVNAAIQAIELTLNGQDVATEQWVDSVYSNASNLSSGTVSDDRLSSNVPRLNAASNAFSGEIRSSGSSFSAISLVAGFNAGTGVLFRGYGQTARFANMFMDGGGVWRMRMSQGTRLAWCNNNDATSGATDVEIVRNATGPAAQIQAAGGLRVCNADGSALAPIECVAGTKSAPGIRMGGSANTGLYSSASGTSPGLGLAISGSSFIYTSDSGTGFILNAAWGYCWGSAQADSSVDTRLTRSSAGVIDVGTTSDNALGSLNLANLTASGGITFGARTKAALLATSATATAGVWRITDSTPAQRLAYPDGTNWRYMSDDTVVT